MSAELEVYEEPQAVSPTLFGTADPAAVIVRATEAAKPLAEVVRQRKLAIKIQGREHVLVEGWTLLGSMLGVFPVTVWTRKLEDGWEARVEARTRDGAIVGAAEAECLRSENLWKSRDDYALRSMAQTRATSKALRQPLGFVMQLAGFEATPAEEMPRNAETDDGEFRFTSGKHSGKTLAEAPVDYLEWYRDNGPKQEIRDQIAAFLAEARRREPEDGEEIAF